MNVRTLIFYPNNMLYSIFGGKEHTIFNYKDRGDQLLLSQLQEPRDPFYDHSRNWLNRNLSR